MRVNLMCKSIEQQEQVLSVEKKPASDRITTRETLRPRD